PCTGRKCMAPCGANQQNCSGQCVSVDDPAHCGSCDTACLANETCSRGSCTVCRSGPVCSNQCVTQPDHDHCGTCENKCGENQACATLTADGGVSYVCASIN